MSDRAPLIRLSSAETAALIVANMNSIVLDYAARTAVGGTDLSYFIIKQLPVMDPSEFLEEFQDEVTYADLIVPRVVELVYTANALKQFASSLGYDGPPFHWNEERRHCLRCELDAIFAHMYGLSRSDLEWILDASPPSSSFPSLKRYEKKKFGEYRTQRLILHAFEKLRNGQNPDIDPGT